MEEIVGLVSSVGFPAAIAIFLLIRFDGIIKSLAISQQKLISAVDKLCNKIDLMNK